MKKRAIAMLLAAAMWTELLAGCSSAVGLVSADSADTNVENTAIEKGTPTLFTDSDGSLKGVIYSSLDYAADPVRVNQNTPVKWAKIQVLDANREPITVDGQILQTHASVDGEFSLQLPTEGEYYLHITADGYKKKDSVRVCYVDYSVTEAEYKEQFQKGFEEELAAHLHALKVLEEEELQEVIPKIEEKLGDVVDETTFLAKRNALIQQLEELLAGNEKERKRFWIDFWKKVDPYATVLTREESVWLTSFSQAISFGNLQTMQGVPYRPASELDKYLTPEFLSTWSRELGALYRNEDGRWENYWNTWGREASWQVAFEGGLWIAGGLAGDGLAILTKSSMEAIRAYKAKKVASYLAKRAESHASLSLFSQEAAILDASARELLNDRIRPLIRARNEGDRYIDMSDEIIAKLKEIEWKIIDAKEAAFLAGTEKVGQNLDIWEDVLQGLRQDLDFYGERLLQPGAVLSTDDLMNRLDEAMDAVQELRGIAMGLEQDRAMLAPYAEAIEVLDRGTQELYSMTAGRGRLGLYEARAQILREQAGIDGALGMTDDVQEFFLSPYQMEQIKGTVSKEVFDRYLGLLDNVEELREMAVPGYKASRESVFSIVHSIRMDLGYLEECAPWLPLVISQERYQEQLSKIFTKMDKALDFLMENSNEIEGFYALTYGRDAKRQIAFLETVLADMRVNLRAADTEMTTLGENFTQLQGQSWELARMEQNGDLALGEFVDDFDTEKYMEVCRQLFAELRKERWYENRIGYMMRGEGVEDPHELIDMALRMSESAREEAILRAEKLQINIDDAYALYEKKLKQIDDLMLAGQKVNTARIESDIALMGLPELYTLNNLLGVMQIVEAYSPDITRGITTAGIALDMYRQLKAGAHEIENAEHVILLEPVLPSVKGRIVNQEGKPVEGAQVVIYTAQKASNPYSGDAAGLVYEEYRRYTTDNTGRFTFELPSEMYKIEYTKYPIGTGTKLFTSEPGENKDLGDLVLKGRLTKSSPSPRVSPTATPTAAPTITPTPTVTLPPKASPSPQVTESPGSQATPSPRATTTPRPKITTTPSPKDTLAVTATPSSKVTPTAIVTVNPEPTVTPQAVASPEVTVIPSPQVTPTATTTASPEASVTPKVIPSP